MLNLIIPSERNNFHPLLISRKFLVFYTIVLFLFNTLFASFLPGIRSEAAASSITAGGLVALTNQSRAASGLGQLTIDGRLSSAAYAKAQDMFAKQYWSHYGPNGETPWQFISGAGYGYVYAGENLAKGFATNEGVHQAWMASPTHRDNILKPYYSNIGIAVLDGNLLGEQVTLVVQMFGTPPGAPPTPPPTPPPPAPSITDSNPVQRPPEPVVTQPQIQTGEIKSIAITAPTEGLQLNSSDLTIQGTVEVVQEVVGSYKVKITDGEVELSEVESSTKEWNFNKKDWIDGNHKVTASVNYNDSTFTDEVNFIVDTTPPAINPDNVEVEYNPATENWFVKLTVSGSDKNVALRSGEVSLAMLNSENPEEEGVFSVLLEDSEKGDSVIVAAQDEFSNRSELDISKYFVKPEPKPVISDSQTGGILGVFESIDLTGANTKSIVNISFATFIFALLAFQIYHYWKQKKIGEKGGYLFTFMMWGLVVIMALINRVNFDGLIK